MTIFNLLLFTINEYIVIRRPMHHRNMFGLFKGCRLARMSSGRYCLVRDLGLVKGGKGMRHHEVVVAFSVRELFKWLRQPSAKRFEPEASADLIRGTNPQGG